MSQIQIIFIIQQRRLHRGPFRPFLGVIRYLYARVLDPSNTHNRLDVSQSRVNVHRTPIIYIYCHFACVHAVTAPTCFRQIYVLFQSVMLQIISPDHLIYSVYSLRRRSILFWLVKSCASYSALNLPLENN